MNDISKYNMTDQEKKAYQLALLWTELTKKFFPDQKLDKVPSKGDPRKCHLFKQCWKLARVTKGLLKDSEYRLYFMANFAILKHHGAYVSPNVICGEKAWYRWKAWKRLYDQQAKVHDGAAPIPSAETTDPKLIVQIDKTKRYLFEKCGGPPTIESITKLFNEGKLKFWYSSGKISAYYLVMSPFISKITTVANLEKAFVFDSKVFTEKITDYVIYYFRKEFSHEYQ